MGSTTRLQCGVGFVPREIMQLACLYTPFPNMKPGVGGKNPNWTQPQRVGETGGWSSKNSVWLYLQSLGKKNCNHVEAYPKKIAGKEMFEAPKIISKSNMTDYTRFRLLSRNGGCQLPSIVLALPSLTSPTSTNKCSKTWQNQQTWMFLFLLHFFIECSYRRIRYTSGDMFVWYKWLKFASFSFRFRGHMHFGIANGT